MNEMFHSISALGMILEKADFKFPSKEIIYDFAFCHMYGRLIGIRSKFYYNSFLFLHHVLNAVYVQ